MGVLSPTVVCACLTLTNFRSEILHFSHDAIPYFETFGWHALRWHTRRLIGCWRKNFSSPYLRSSTSRIDHYTKDWTDSFHSHWKSCRRHSRLCPRVTICTCVHTRYGRNGTSWHPHWFPRAHTDDCPRPRVFLKHGVGFILLPHYKPYVTGELRVVGVDAMKLIKSRAVLIAQFWSPQLLRDATIQMYCTSLEPKRGLGQGDNFGVLTAIKHTLPHGTSLHDIGVWLLSAAASDQCHVGYDNRL